MQIIVGVTIMCFSLVVWGRTGKDPLQLSYCYAARIVPPLRDSPSCEGPQPDRDSAGNSLIVQVEMPDSAEMRATDVVVVFRFKNVGETPAIVRRVSLLTELHAKASFLELNNRPAKQGFWLFGCAGAGITDAERLGTKYLMDRTWDRGGVHGATYHNPKISIGGIPFRDDKLIVPPHSVVSALARFRLEQIDEVHSNMLFFCPIVHATNAEGEAVFSLCLGSARLWGRQGRIWNFKYVEPGRDKWTIVLPRRQGDSSCRTPGLELTKVAEPGWDVDLQYQPLELPRPAAPRKPADREPGRGS